MTIKSSGTQQVNFPDPGRQQGFSLLSWVLILFVISVMGTMAVAMIPAYMDYNTICGTVDELLSSPTTNLMGPDEIETTLAKRFDINDITAIHASDLAITKDNGKLNIALYYKFEKPLFYNVSFVMHSLHIFSKMRTGQ